jgi:putative mRNA 3-end processing factor
MMIEKCRRGYDLNTHVLFDDLSWLAPEKRGNESIGIDDSLDHNRPRIGRSSGAPMKPEIVQPAPSGLYCPAGDFYIDPRWPVDRAVITHAHADHARPGSRAYFCAAPCRRLLRERLGPGACIEALAYGEVRAIGAARLCLHPAGHVLGSARVKIVVGGRTAVVSGDFKTDLDPTCAPLEPLRCDELISESTFGLPIFRWPPPEQVMAEINRWWAENAARGRPSVLLAYALGKAQRILAGLDPAIGPILVHGAVEKINRVYRTEGVALPETVPFSEAGDRRLRRSAMIIAPPSALRSAWMRPLAGAATAFASGWMLLRRHRLRQAVDRGFVLSDHSDWNGLMATIAASGAEIIGITHGYETETVRWLTGRGYCARALSTPDGHPVAADVVSEAGGG